MLNQLQAFGLCRHVVVEPVIPTPVIAALKLGRNGCLSADLVAEPGVRTVDPNAVSYLKRLD